MSRMKLLKQVLDDLDNLNQSISELVNAVGENREESDIKEKQETVITLEEVRGVLAEKSRAGFTKEVKAFIQTFGVNKLSDVNPRDYALLLKKAKELSHE